MPIGGIHVDFLQDGVSDLYLSVSKIDNMATSSFDVDIQINETFFEGGSLSFRNDDTLLSFVDSLTLANGHDVYIELDDEQVYLNRPPVLPNMTIEQMTALTTLDNGTMIYNSEIKQRCIKIANITQNGVLQKQFGDLWEIIKM